MGARRSVLVDDFGDDVAVLNFHKEHGVEIVSSDVATDGMSKIKGDFDAINCFDSFEHWHNSPKSAFHQVLSRLKPGGIFILSGPNSVNVKKRITVPLGKGTGLVRRAGIPWPRPGADRFRSALHRTRHETPRRQDHRKELAGRRGIKE